MGKLEEAAHAFENGYSCAQAILTAFGPEEGIDRETALRLAGGFGAGFARTGEVCGAVSGACMVIGLRSDVAGACGRDEREKAYDSVRAFVETFKAKHGSILCRDLLGCPLDTPEGRKKAKDQDLFHKLCSRYVHSAAEILGEDPLKSPSEAE